MYLSRERQVEWKLERENESGGLGLSMSILGQTSGEGFVHSAEDDKIPGLYYTLYHFSILAPFVWQTSKSCSITGIFLL